MIRKDFVPSTLGARLKVERAARHHSEFNEKLLAFLTKEPYRTVRKVYAEGPRHELEATEELPPQLGVILGDCIQNFRVALDYLAWQCALRFRIKPDRRRSSFPVVKCREDWKGTKNLPGRKAECAHCGPDAQALIESLQSYHRRNCHDPADLALDPLWGLNELARIDRHQVLHPTALLQQGSLSSFVNFPRIGNVPAQPELFSGFFVTAPVEVDAKEGGWVFDVPPINWKPNMKVLVQHTFDITLGETAGEAARFGARQCLEAIEETFQMVILPSFQALFHESV